MHPAAGCPGQGLGARPPGWQYYVPAAANSFRHSPITPTPQLSRWGGTKVQAPTAPQGLPPRGAALSLLPLQGVRAGLLGVPQSWALAVFSPRPVLAVGSCLDAPSTVERSPPGAAWPFGAGRPRRRSPRSPRGFVGVASRRSWCRTCVASAAALLSRSAVRERPRSLTVGCGVSLVCPAVQPVPWRFCGFAIAASLECVRLRPSHLRTGVTVVFLGKLGELCKWWACLCLWNIPAAGGIVLCSWFVFLLALPCHPIWGRWMKDDTHFKW